MKHDQDKLRYDLLPVNEIEEVVEVLTHGSKKYADYNWQKVVAVRPDRYYAAMLRHIVAWRKGDVRDEDDGLHPLAHAICCALFLMWNDNKEAK